jgi:hypothetical protein
MSEEVTNVWEFQGGTLDLKQQVEAHIEVHENLLETEMDREMILWRKHAIETLKAVKTVGDFVNYLVYECDDDSFIARLADALDCFE